MANRTRVIGIHPIVADQPVNLVEIEVEADDFDFGEVTQMVSGQPRSNWQADYED